MAGRKSTERRRKSIAATANQNQPPVTKGKRRHSVAPGSRLSPLAKARRSLVPRKSILKASLNLSTPDVAQPDPQSESNPQSCVADDVDFTTTNFTRDFQTEVHDNTTCKSLTRRVSFAAHAHVRLFETAGNNTNSTLSPQSSPTASPSAASTDEDDEAQDSPQPQKFQAIRDENAYPGATAFSRRRSSLRRSVGGGEESMDVDTNHTARGPFAFLPGRDTSGSAILDDNEEEDDGSSGGEMEMTEAIKENLLRRQSLADGTGQRRPLSIVQPQAPPDHSQSDASYEQDADESRTSYDDENSTQSSAGTDPSTKPPVEYTVPLSKPLNPPAPPDDLWYALRKMTHSGDTPCEFQGSSDDEGQQHESGDGMGLDHAVERLMNARSSLSLAQGAGHNGSEVEEDSFSSIDNSFGEDVDIGNQTMNISKVFGKIGMGGSNASKGAPSTHISASKPPTPVQPPPPQPNVELPTESTQPSVFHPLPSQSQAINQPERTPAAQEPTKSGTPDVTPTLPPSIPPSPSKANILAVQPASAAKRPTLSAAFMPPVSRPSPKKRPNPTVSEENDAENADSDKPSTAKRTAMADKWTAAVSPQVATEAGVSSAEKSRPLSPSKKALFQSPQPQTKPRSTTTSSLRRPSGYFSRRKSMGVGSFTAAKESTEGNDASGPAKKSGLGLGRVSMGGKSLGLTADLSSFADKMRANAKDRPNAESLPPAKTVHTPGPGSPTRPSSHVPPAPARTAQTPPGVDVSDQGDGDDGMDIDRGASADVMKSTAQWRENVQQHEFAADDESPPISIEQFFAMTAIRFMDEITVPRQSMHPSQFRSNSRNRQASSEEAREIPLAEYVIAMAVDVPQLKLYTRVAKDLQAWIAQSKVVYTQAEEEAAKLTPELFTEYSQADEEGQEQLLHQLHLMKANSRSLAKSDWYDWKLGWVNGLFEVADKGFVELQADAKGLEKINSRVTEILPALEAEHDQVMRELEQEQAVVAEIESSDKDYLSELKASITEQNLEVEALRAEISERGSQIQWLQERLIETDAHKQESIAVIAQASRMLHIQKHSTTAEVFRLKDRLETLETLHMFRVTTVNAEMFEFIYASQFRVSVPCLKFRPRVEKVAISRLDAVKTQHKDAFPHLSHLWLRAARERVARRKELSTIQIAQYLGDYWSSCSQLRSQLLLLKVKYPVSIEIMPSETLGFRAKAAVISPKSKAKVTISFVFDDETFALWPLTIPSVKCEVEIIYGTVDSERIYKAVAARLAEANSAENHACLLDACISAMEEYP